MNIQLVAPPLDLRFLIQGYWYADAASVKHPTYRIFSDGYPGLIFQHVQGNPGLFRGTDVLPLCFIYGQKSKGFCLNECEAGTLFFGIQFQPYAFKQLMGIDASVLTDCCLDARELFRGLAIEPLVEFEHWMSFVSYFNAYFRTLNCRVEQNPYIIPIVSNFDSYFTFSSSQVAQMHHVSARKFQRDFKSYVGLSFEAYRQLIKFQKAAYCLKKHPETKIVDIAYALYYADQAHFGRIFKFYSGYTPKEFMDKQWNYNESEVIHHSRLRILSQ
ncbi:helix-turn-helix domain-containing protein [Myroides sp. C15-4]|uniref:helix-turn-helix domain-containing protein n=1 Tax=Myroides sp. C15-4 TaxID=3400532 RepID=UPI003D2F6F1F